MNNRGYFGIGIYNTKNECNIGTLWRSAYILEASFIFTIGKRYKKQCSDTVQAYKHLPLYEYIEINQFYNNIPNGCCLLGIEQNKRSIDLVKFSHPERAIYLLGAEDYGLPEEVMNKCHGIISIDTNICLNVSVAGSIIMYDRRAKNERS